MNRISILKSKKLYLSLALILSFIFTGSVKANPKLLPTMKDYKAFNLKKNNVSKITYRVYHPSTSDVTKIGESADFIPSIEFDAAGFRVKETVYHIETEKQESLTSWDYNLTNSTVTQIRLDTINVQKWKRLISGNIKAGTASIKTYEPWFDNAKSEMHPEKLTFSDEWKTIKKKKTVQQETSYYSLERDIIAKRSTRDFATNKALYLNSLIELATATDDYTWLIAYTEDNIKANIGALRKEKIYDGTTYVYKAKKKLIVSKTKLGKDGKTVESTIGYKYEFDKNGNWIKLTQTDNNAVRFIVVRNIEYR